MRNRLALFGLLVLGMVPRCPCGVRGLCVRWSGRPAALFLPARFGD